MKRYLTSEPQYELTIFTDDVRVNIKTGKPLPEDFIISVQKIRD